MELIAVMLIVVILSTLVAVAFNRLGQKNLLVTNGNQAVDSADLARQNSLAKNCLTALVLLTDVEPDRTHQAFGLLQLLPKADGTSPQTSDWTQITAWQELSPGTCVDVALNASSLDACTFLEAASVASSPALPTSFFFEGRTINTSKNVVKYVVFLPGGSLFKGAAAQVELVEGFLPPGSISTAVPAATYTHPIPGSSPVLAANYYRITLVGATGRIRIDRS